MIELDEVHRRDEEQHCPKCGVYAMARDRGEYTTYYCPNCAESWYADKPKPGILSWLDGEIQRVMEKPQPPISARVKADNERVLREFLEDEKIHGGGKFGKGKVYADGKYIGDVQEMDLKIESPF